MTLPLSDLVQVDIAVSPVLAPLAGFGELLFLTNDPLDLAVLTMGERTRKFGSPSEVTAAFGSYVNSEVLVAANTFYAMTPQPKEFTVGVMAKSAYSGELLGGLHGSLVDMNTVTDGVFSYSFDNGEAITTAAVSLAGASSFEAVAQLITTAITPVGKGRTPLKSASPTCSYVNNRFIVTSPTQGSGSVVTPLVDVSSTIGALLGLDASLSTPVSGGDLETVSQALSAVQNISNSFIGVTLHKSLRDKDESISGQSGAGIWCQANKKLFMNTTNDSQIFGLNQGSTEAGKLHSQALSKTITSYGKIVAEYPSVSLFARLATVNYEGRNTTITTMFKKLPTITALPLTSAQKASMDKINVGGFMSFGGNLMYAEGRMADNGWLDTAHGLMWLENRIQTGVFNLMYGTATKIPFTDTGLTMVEQRVTTALEQGVANGMIAAGYTPEGEFLPTGYKVILVPLAQVAAEDKSNRIYRGCSFIAVGAGALQGAVISGSFSE